MRSTRFEARSFGGFIGFGAMEVTKLYKFIGFGAMDVTKTYKFIGFELPVFYGAEIVAGTVCFF